MANLYTHQDSNIQKTWLLMTMFLVLVVGLGWLFSYVRHSPGILYGAIIFSLLMNILAYWKSDSIALAMSGAKPVAREEDTRLYRLVENLCITAGLPMPRIFKIKSVQINAFATGRDPQHAAVAVTHGALDKLNDNELQGVLAHELSHIGNRDILISSAIVVLAGIISIMADMFLRISMFGGRRDDDDRDSGSILVVVALIAAILAPIATTLIRLAVSRKREFLADASGALLTRYPEGLANALEKIAQDSSPMPRASTSTAHLFISNPFKGRQGVSWLGKLFMTHPPIQERIAALRTMEK